MTYPYTFLYLYILLVLYQTVLSPVGVKNRDSSIDTRRYFLTYTLLHIKSTYVSISCSYLYLFYHVFHLTLTKRLVHLVQQVSFQTRYGHQISLNIIWLYSRLNELSIESKNTHNRVLTKELCKLQAVKKISDLQHLQQPLAFDIFGNLNFIFDTISLYSFKYKVLMVLIQLESSNSEHRNSRYDLDTQVYSMFKTGTRIWLEHGPTLSECLGHLESEFDNSYIWMFISP